MTNDAVAYEDILLAGWEEVYRKSQLSLLMLLALKDGPKFTAEIRQFVQEVTQGLQATDEQSIYRALRRHHQAGMVRYQEVAGRAGPNRKRYELTGTGTAVLGQFLQRNIINVLYDKRLQSLILEEDRHYGTDN